MTRARRRIAVLGSTGSIGKQALDVVAQSLDPMNQSPFELERVAVSAHSQADVIATQVRDVHDSQRSTENPPAVLLADPAAREQFQRSGSTARVFDSVADLLDHSRPDLVLNSVVGFAGLATTIAALERGIDVALANKESLVAAGSLCLETARTHDAVIYPVDSEHSALQQCWSTSSAADVESLVLTASGGPFFGRSAAELADVTVEQALDHPTWNMGGKITIDSATLMNKGLELIEAMVLFGIPADRIEIAVHRHSIVHALVRHVDGSLLAHLGWPDMRVPIAWALHYPHRTNLTDIRRLDLTQMPPLEFDDPDMNTFRCLKLARGAAERGAGVPCVLNAANEVAVHAFLSGGITFPRIADVVEHVLEAVDDAPLPTRIEDAYELDALARRVAHEHVA